MHPEFATPESFSLYLQRIELTIYGIQSMMSTLLIVGGAAWCNSASNVGLNTDPKAESGSRVFDHPPEKQMKSHIVPASKLRRLRAKATRQRLYHSAQEGCKCAASAEASKSTGQTGDVTEELIPLSRVESVLEESMNRQHQIYEESSRKLLQEIRAHCDIEVSALSSKLAYCQRSCWTGTEPYKIYGRFWMKRV